LFILLILLNLLLLLLGFLFFKFMSPQMENTKLTPQSTQTQIVPQTLQLTTKNPVLTEPLKEEKALKQSVQTEKFNDENDKKIYYRADGKTIFFVDEYDKITNKIIKKTSYYFDGESIKFVIEYDKDTGNMIKKTEYQPDGKNIKKIDEYDKDTDNTIEKQIQQEIKKSNILEYETENIVKNNPFQNIKDTLEPVAKASDMVFKSLNEYSPKITNLASMGAGMRNFGLKGGGGSL
ncbi:hypothetical protein C6B37_01340, partial [Candidatus Phytoplasma phoenicium]